MTPKSKDRPAYFLSVLLPVFNEEGLLPALYARLTAALGQLGCDYEVVAVDDGSRDGSPILLKELAARDPRWKLLSFSRNFGHQTAVSAGIYYCSGDVAAVLDADLQDPPEVLGKLLAKWQEGYEVVYAVRRRRKERWIKRASYAAFYRLLRAVASVDIPLDAGDFCVMDRRVLDVIRRLPERTRFVRGLRTWSGFRQVGVEYERQGRHAGESKYTLGKLFRLSFDGIISFSSLPLRLASWIGMALCAGTFISIGILFVWWATNVTILGMRPSNVLGWSSLIMTLMFLSGVQMLLFGIQGEYLSRVYDEVKAREPWIIADARGFDSAWASAHPGWHVRPPRMPTVPQDPAADRRTRNVGPFLDERPL